MADLPGTSDWIVGLEMPEFIRGPITRRDLALFAGGSHDHVAFHIDSDAAKAAGFDDVIAHGMLCMAYLGQALTHWVDQDRLLAWNARFVSMTPLYATINCRGSVLAITEDATAKVARLSIVAWAGPDRQALVGEALVRLG